MTGRERFLKVSLSGWIAAGVAWFALMHPGVTLAAGDLTPEEVRQMSRFDVGTAGPHDVEEARALFAGRGPDIARHFLTHTDVPRADYAYFFLLQALADTDTALVLIRALWDPPKIISGFVVKAGDSTSILGRDRLQILAAIEHVLGNESVRSDPRTVAALVEAIAHLRASPGADPHFVGMAVTMLGHCAGPEAVAALQKLAGDPEPSIRSLAIEGLGRTASTDVNVNSNRKQLGHAAEDEKKDRSSALPAITRTLGSDLDPRVRAEAATALGNLGSAEAIPGLREALAKERHPQVVDAIVLALEKLGAPLTDPQSCREVVSRTWDPYAARGLFSCWRASASREAVIEAATRGPAQLRALALYSLVERAAGATKPPIVAVAPPMVAPPAPLGAKAIINVPIPPPESARVSFDEATRDRLLASAAGTLSRPIMASPGKGEGISDKTAQLVYDAMWEISGRNMATALAYADRISPPLATRHADAGRYWASYYLENKERSAYLDYRQPRQAAAAVILALAFGTLLAWRKTRRAAATLVLAALGWGVSSFFETEMRELPPPPLQFLSVSAIGFFSAGISVAGMALWKSRAAGTALRAIGRAVASVAIAAVLAFAVCVFVHGAFFPGMGGGWELIFDPLGSVVIAAPAAAALAFVDGIFLRRLLGTTG